MSENYESVLLTPNHVAHYLSEHPNFFTEHRELLTRLTVPHDSGGISLVERQVKALRDKNRELQSQMIDMLRHARENELLLAQCSALSLALVSCRTADEVLQTLRQQLQKDFQCDAVALLVCQPKFTLPTTARLVSHPDLLTATGCEFPDTEPVCGTLEHEVRCFVFGELRLDLQSVALLPLGQFAQNGLLGIASKKPDRFTPQMGTVFLQLIGNLLNALLQRYSATT